jgi:ATP-dependent Clp protease ATP-binding subunit ClpA
MFERFARSTREIVWNAVEEAGRRGDRRVGTDHLLMALLNETDISRLVGADKTAAQAAATRLDQQSIAAIGLDLGDFEPAECPRTRTRPPFTPAAKAVLKQSLGNAVAGKSRRIAPTHLLLALLDRRQPDPAAALLAALAVNPEVIHRRLAAL